MNTRLLGVQDVLATGVHRLLGRHAKAQARAPISEADYRAAQAKALRAPFIVHKSRLALAMGVNHGRWVGHCPECSAGVMVDRGWSEARCFSCGGVFDAILWPEDMAVIERELLKRPIQNQNYLPGEGAAALVVQNIQHRVHMGRGLQP